MALDLEPGAHLGPAAAGAAAAAQALPTWNKPILDRSIKRALEQADGTRPGCAHSGGFAQFLLADCMPAVTWSVLGHDRQPKRGYDALATACQPVIVVADRLDASVRAGMPLDIDVHVVSDLHRPLAGCVVVARLCWE